MILYAVWVFYGPGQNIYGSSEVPWASWPLITLRKNCRNTRSVARWAFDHIASKPELPDQTPDGMEVIDVICTEREAMLETLRGWIHELTMERHLTADRILILTPYRRDTSVLFGVTKIGNSTIEEYPTVTRNAIAWSTLQRFKGLESDVVLLVDVTAGSNACSPTNLYVAGSRARMGLRVARYAGE